MKYQQCPNHMGEPATSIIRVDDGACIPFDPANTDYANFKAQINADEAQLQDADGNLMTAEQAKAFVATLP
jgi:hypothetical protein